MEAMTGKAAKSIITGMARHREGDAKAVPNYLRPSTGSCHHACKYGGQHTFEEKEAPKAQPKPRKQPPVLDDQKRRLIKVRSVSRRRVGDFSKPDKANRPVVETVEWKDIVAYDAVPLPAVGSSSQPDKIYAKLPNSSDGKKRDVMKGKKPFAKITEQEIVVKKQTESLNKKLVKSVRSKLTGKASTDRQAANKARETLPSDKNMIKKSTNSVKPPKAKKSTMLPVEKKVLGQEMVQEDATTNVKEGETIPSCPRRVCWRC